MVFMSRPSLADNLTRPGQATTLGSSAYDEQLFYQLFLIFSWKSGRRVAIGPRLTATVMNSLAAALEDLRSMSTALFGG